MTTAFPIDLILLVPGNDDRETFKGILSKRQKSFGIRSIRYEIQVHPQRDPGCFQRAPDLLRLYLLKAERALVVFDAAGSGQETRAVHEIEADLKDRLANNGWGERAEVLVINPELEVWVWSDSKEVDAVLGWKGRIPALRNWLQHQQLWKGSDRKPQEPRRALETALREVNIPRSSSLYRKLAERVSLDRCQDDSFVRLRQILQTWFPPSSDMRSSRI